MTLYDNPRLRRNNFDLLRLVLAATVCLVHVHNLSALEDLRWLSSILSSDIAVKGFFVVSGFLIFMSYERAKSAGVYAKNRFNRIYPAYVVVILLCAIGLFGVSKLQAAEYFSFTWVRYLVANLVFLNFIQPSLAGVFENQSVNAVNGALWTLKIEVLFYFSVPLIVWAIRRSSALTVLGVCYLGSVSFSLLMNTMLERTGNGLYAELGRQLPGQLSYFVAGAYFYYFLPLFERRKFYFLAFAASAIVIDRFYALPMLQPFALATMVVYFGLYIYLGNFGKFGDFSYGLYILHFPIIQLLVQARWFEASPYGLLATTIAITGVASVLMWHLVEKRFLRRSSHYVSATSAESSVRT